MTTESKSRLRIRPICHRPLFARAILERSGIARQDAPTFHYYLERHIHLDEGSHGPLSLRLLNGLCHSEQEREEAVAAAREAVQARVRFWDGVLEALDNRSVEQQRA